MILIISCNSGQFTTISPTLAGFVIGFWLRDNERSAWDDLEDWHLIREDPAYRKVLLELLRQAPPDQPVVIQDRLEPFTLRSYSYYG